MATVRIIVIFIQLFMINKTKGQTARITIMDDNLQFKNDNEGQSCSLLKGTLGTCEKPYNCMDALHAYVGNGIPLEFCSVSENSQVTYICCEKTDNTMLKFGNSIELKESISEQKCKDYTSYATYNTQLRIGVDESWIAGGDYTVPSEFPHMVAIGWTKADGIIIWNCGGTLISENFILTAGHCSADGDVPPDVVRISDQNLKTSTDNIIPQDFKILEIIQHPNYTFSSVYNDVALIKLDGNVTLHSNLRPACLWQNEHINSTEAIATGWGRTGYLEPLSDELQKVTLDILSNNICKDFLKPQKKFRDGIVHTQMCAGVVSGGKDTCQGDSGGPLQLKYNYGNYNIYHVIGVTSFGTFCAAKNSPGVYTRVSSYIDWIESIVWQK